MKYIVLLILVFCGGMASAQFRPAPTPVIWTGDELFGLSVGSAYITPALSADAFDVHQSLPIAASLHYAGEKAVGTHWVVGHQAEFNYLRSRIHYTLDGRQTTSANNWLRHDVSSWSTCVDVRLLAGYYITEQVSPFVSVGLYENLLVGGSSTVTPVDKTSGQEGTPQSSASKPSFGFEAGFSAAAGVNYYLNDNFYTTATARVHVPFGWAEERHGPVYSLTVGIGYKFIK
ncbi:MAG: outer membrane beta-barrel protein [Bacteroidales bacterium]|nr:outer membrane beta-barrel protein [Bacteroidales bacterium]